LKYLQGIGATIFLCSLCSFAGIDLRLGGGLNLSNEAYTGDYKLPSGYNQSMHVGFNVGANVALSFPGPMGIVTGLNFETRGSGWTNDGDSRTAEFALQYLQIPALFSYRPFPGLAVSIGPELGIFLKGKEKLNGQWSDMGEAEKVKAIDFGVSLTIDYTILNMINAGVGYYQGFLNNDDRASAPNLSGGIINSNIKIFVAYVLHFL